MKRFFTRINVFLLLLLAAAIFDACNTAGGESPAGRRLLQINGLHELRAAHSATLLPDGKVLIVAGFRKGPNGYSQLYTPSAELFDPLKQTFTLTGSLHVARCGQTATLLSGGKEVLITGGNNDRPGLSGAELYTIRSGEWTQLPDMLAGREGHQALLLRSGKVLILGGTTDLKCQVEFYNPASHQFEAGAPAPFLLSGTAIQLADGRILVTGKMQDREPGQMAMVYDPVSDRYTRTGDMSAPRYKCGTALLPDGKVMVIGGSNNKDWKGKYSSTEIYDPVTGAFGRGPELNFERFKLGRSIISLPNGDIVVAGGDKHIEQFHPADGRWSVVATLDQPYYFSSATLLPDGKILLVGGYGNDVQPTAKAWIFKP